ncbi:MAG: transcriptional repressor [Acidimicrobiales bacterium]|nr:transcriptional repressor [Acidimicrobiales bacterium]
MTALLDRLRQRGWRLTAQRRAVAGVLAGEHVHLTADQVLQRARAVLPEVSQATVYATLAELVAMGELREVALDGGARRFDPNVGDEHQHLVCRSCGAIRDVHPAGVGGLRLGRGDRAGYRLDGIDVTFRGLCPGCAAR